VVILILNGEGAEKSQVEVVRESRVGSGGKQLVRRVGM
jgi:hypothetical protein